MELKAGFWQIAIDEALKQYTAFTRGNLGFLMQTYAIWTVQCSSYISEINAELPRGTEPNVLLNLFV